MALVSLASSSEVIEGALSSTNAQANRENDVVVIEKVAAAADISEEEEEDTALRSETAINIDTATGLRGATARRLPGDYFNPRSWSAGEAGVTSGALLLIAIFFILYCCCGCSLMDMLVLFCCYELCCDG